MPSTWHTARPPTQRAQSPGQRQRRTGVDPALKQPFRLGSCHGELTAAQHAGGSAGRPGRDPPVPGRRRRQPGRRDAQPDGGAPRARGGRGMVGALQRRAAAPAVLAEQELHLHRGRVRAGRGPARPGRHGDLPLHRVRRRHHRSAQPVHEDPARRLDGQRPYPGDAGRGDRTGPGRAGPRVPADPARPRARHRLRLQPALHVHAGQHHPAQRRDAADPRTCGPGCSTRSASGTSAGRPSRPGGSRASAACTPAPRTSPSSGCCTCSAAGGRAHS